MYDSKEGLVCNVNGYDSEVLPHQYYLWCRTYVISIFLSWMNVFTFFVAIILSMIISRKKKNNDLELLNISNIPITNNNNNTNNNDDNTNNTN